MEPMLTDDTPPLLRHALATLAYRAAKVVRSAPPDFATFSAGEGARSPAEILAHIGDLLDWALGLADGRHTWGNSAPLPWDDESERCFACLARLDARLASHRPVCPPEQLFQGPIADALAHVGQIALLRRLAGSPVRGENYFRAGIEPGRVGRDQPSPGAEFD